MARTTAPRWDVVSPSVAFDLESRRQTAVTYRWRGGDDPLMEIESGDGRTLTFVPGHAEAATRHLFPDAPTDGEPAPPPLRDPVNLDGSPRPALRDKLARRGLLTETAGEVRLAAALRATAKVLAARARPDAWVPPVATEDLAAD